MRPDDPCGGVASHRVEPAGSVTRVRRPPERGDDERGQQRERVELDHRREADGRRCRGIPAAERRSTARAIANREDEAEHGEQDVGSELDRHRDQARRREPEQPVREPPAPVAEQPRREDEREQRAEEVEERPRTRGRASARCRGRAARGRRSAPAPSPRGVPSLQRARRRRRDRDGLGDREARMVDERHLAAEHRGSAPRRCTSRPRRRTSTTAIGPAARRRRARRRPATVAQRPARAHRRAHTRAARRLRLRGVSAARP